MGTPVKKEPRKPMNEEELSRQRIIAKTAFSVFEPFLAQLGASRRFTINRNGHCFTDGKNIVLDENFIQDFPRGQVFGFSHEMWHIAFNHMARYKALQGKPHEMVLHNILADAKINELLKKSIQLTDREWKVYSEKLVVDANVKKNLGKILKDGWEKHFKENESCDQQFAALRPFLKVMKIKIRMPGAGGEKGEEEEQEVAGGEGEVTVTIDGLMEDPTAMGKDADGNPLSDQELQQIAAAVKQSISNAKMRGHTGGNMLAELEAIWVTPQVPWRKILSAAIRTRLKHKASWSKISRRSFFS